MFMIMMITIHMKRKKEGMKDDNGNEGSDNNNKCR